MIRYECCMWYFGMLDDDDDDDNDYDYEDPRLMLDEICLYQKDTKGRTALATGRTCVWRRVG